MSQLERALREGIIFLNIANEGKTLHSWLYFNSYDSANKIARISFLNQSHA